MQKRLLKITIINNEISVQERIDNELIPLRKEGEESFEFDSSFWDWFKEKIEYEGEPLEFIVNSSKEIEFDSSLNISDIKYIRADEPQKRIKKYSSLAQFLINKVKKYKER